MKESFHKFRESMDGSISPQWLLSDRVYIDRGIESVFTGLGGFDKRKLKNHYMSMAKSNWKKYSTLEFSSQKTKKYLYVIRSILCWRLLNQDIYPPINMNDLLNHDHINLDDDIKCAIQSLIDYHQGKNTLNFRQNTHKKYIPCIFTGGVYI